VSTLTLAAPAKINLFLHVTGRRADGYHLLESLVAFADCGETVTLSPAASTTVTASGPFAAVLPQDGNDTLSRALAAFTRATGVPFPCAVKVDKQIPAGAGLGGGSADAAAVLRGVMQLSGRTLPPAALTALAASVGADVPVCLLHQAAVMRGIGEQVTPCPLPAPLAAVLVNPGISLSTPEIFNRRSAPFRPRLTETALSHLTEARLRALLLETTNDLQPAAVSLAPVIGTALAALAAEAGCWLARMTGSGSTCFGLFENAALATVAAEKLAARFAWVRAVRLS
jgi:4-diphosphocytidyl-2-C-methyl-D-erythritol kinase